MINRYYLRDFNRKMTESLAYQVLKYPRLTEKSSVLASSGIMTFIVDLKYNKCDVKKACEMLFGEKIKSINSLVIKDRKRSFKGTRYLRSNKKKVIIAFENTEAVKKVLGEIAK